MSSEMTPELQLPGFRFHPTEEELLEFYLKSVVLGKRLRCDIIEFLNIYRHDPWELPGLSKIGEREWYFFVPRDKKHGSGGRPNRTTDKGFWKATGSDRKIVSLSDPKRIIGLRKTLVFYIGRAPRGTKTDWVMNEYRLPDNSSKLLKDIVLCKIYRKATSLKVLEQRAAMEDDQLKMRSNANSPEFSSSPPSSMDTIMSFSSSQQQEREHHLDLTAQIPMMPTINHVVFKKEDAALAVEDQQKEDHVVFKKEDAALAVEDQQKEEEEQAMEIKEYYSPSIQVPFGKDELPDLLVPKMSMDWTQDQFWAPMNSPWLLTPYANLLNF